VTMVRMSLRGKAPPMVDSELSQAELAAIGRVTVLWAELEHLVLDATLALADIAGIPPPEDAYSFAFKKRLRTARILAKECLVENDFKAWVLGVFNKISALEQGRNRITHGLWEWLPSDPASTKAFSHRKKLEFNERFDFQKLTKLGRTVGEVVFVMRYPGGITQFLEENAEAATQPGGVEPRFWRLMLAGKDPQNPQRPLSNYLERIKASPSSSALRGVAKAGGET